MKKFTIVEIIDWEEDRHAMAGDACHMPDSDVEEFHAKQYGERVEKGNWPNLPFVCEAESEDAAIDKYNKSLGRFNYLYAVDAVFAEDEANA